MNDLWPQWSSGRFSKRFGRSNEVHALDGVDLSVKEAEFMVLLGPSGSGKTTLMRIVAGLDTPSTGEVRIGDQVVNDLPRHLARQVRH